MSLSCSSPRSLFLDSNDQVSTDCFNSVTQRLALSAIFESPVSGWASVGKWVNERAMIRDFEFSLMLNILGFDERAELS